MTIPAITSGPLDLVFVKNTQATQFRCGVFNIRLSGRHAGTVSFVGIAPRQARIGYEIRPQFRRQGLGSRAIAALLDAAPEFGFDLLRAECRSNNTPSRRILEKSGFVQHSSAPFWTNGNDSSLRFLVYLWSAPSAAARPKLESCAQ